MTKLNNTQLQEIDGGAIKWGLLGGIAAAISFFVGFFDGYSNPKKCNN